MAEMQAELQRLSGTTLDAQGAANAWAGTSGLDLLGALNTKAGLVSADWVGLNAVWRSLTGGSGDAQLEAGRARNAIRLPGTAGNYASTPDSVALSIVGDIDIRMRIALPDWTPAAAGALISKRGATTSWLLRINAGGTLEFVASDATGAAVFGFTTTLALSFVDGAAAWVRVVFDADNGAAGRTVTYYTSVNGVTWTQFDVPKTVAIPLGLFDSTIPIEIGSLNAGVSAPLLGTIYYAEIRNGINGTVVATFDPQVVTGTRTPASWTGPQGNVWTVNGSAWSWGVGA